MITRRDIALVMITAFLTTLVETSGVVLVLLPRLSKVEVKVSDVERRMDGFTPVFQAIIARALAPRDHTDPHLAE